MKRYIKNATDYIVGMSKGRRELGGWIEDHTVPVMVALAQLYIFPNGCRTHWRQKVWDKFHEMKRFMHNKKLPDAQFILDNSWSINKSEHDLDTVIRYVIKKEKSYEPRKDINKTELSSIMESYFTWLADKLSDEFLLDVDEVKQKLDELGLNEKLLV